MRYLITQSLLNSWLWYINFTGDDDSKAEQDFSNTLNRMPIPDNIHMQRGRQFENDIQKYVIGSLVHSENPDDYEMCVEEIAHIVTGGVWQVAGYIDMTINDIDYLLYGRADVLLGPTIFDIKCVSKYEPGKYFSSPQHKMYFACFPGTIQFEYLISDRKEVYRERYQREETEPIESLISEFQTWLSNNKEYEDIFFYKWNTDKKIEPRLSPDEINRLFNEEMNRRLSTLKKDMCP